MKVLVKIPAPLRVWVSNNKEVEIEFEGQTLKDALLKLVEIYPNLKDRLFDENNNMKKFLAVFINDVSARELGGENAKINENDVISILPAIAGG